VPWGRAFALVTKGFVMKKELKAVLSAIDKVLADSRGGPGHRDQLCKIRRELEVIARSGKIERRRVFLLIQRIAEILLELIGK
jgi:hypothetical protein